MLLHIADWRAVSVPKTKIVSAAKAAAVKFTAGARTITAAGRKA